MNMEERTILQDPHVKELTPFEHKIWLSSPTMHGEELRYVKEAIETNWVSTVGENIDELEKMTADYLGMNYAVALSSGTAALHMCVKLAGERINPGARQGRSLEGQKVFCSDMTFAASVNPVVYEGGEPVFIDSEYDTWNMDPEALEKAFKIFPEVKLVVLAHLYGVPANMDRILTICRKHGTLIVEDVAEALGSSYRTGQTETKEQRSRNYSESEPSNYFTTMVLNEIGTESHATECSQMVNRRQVMDYCLTVDRDRVSDVSQAVSKSRETERSPVAEGAEDRKCGSFGDYAAISFNGNKIVTGSSGGMFVTNNKEDADKVRKWSTQSREVAPWYQHEELGYNYRMSNIIAGIARGQFPYLDEHIRRKKEIYMRYKEGFSDLPLTMNPYLEGINKPNFWLSCMLIDKKAMCRQLRGNLDAVYVTESGKSCPAEVFEKLNSFNVESRPIWKPMHMQPLYMRNWFITKNMDAKGITKPYIDGYKENTKNVGADIFERGLCLPSDNKMTCEEQNFVIEIVHRCFQ